MKPLLIWLAVVAVVFGGYALITSAVRETEQVFVVVDSSFQMRPVWRDVPVELDRIDNQEHAEFVLSTTMQGPIHSSESSLELVGVDTPFGVCTFAGIGDSPAAQDADKRILITTTPSPDALPTDNLCDTTALTDWEIIYLDP